MLGDCKDQCVCDNFPDVSMCSDNGMNGNGNNGNNGNNNNGRRRRRSFMESYNLTEEMLYDGKYYFFIVIA